MRPTKRELTNAVDALGGADPEPLPPLTESEAAAIEAMFTTDDEGRLDMALDEDRLAGFRK
jgi:hypothetical protein